MAKTMPEMERAIAKNVKNDHSLQLRQPKSNALSLFSNKNRKDLLLSQVISALLRFGRAEILKDFPVDSCVASTAVVIDVLSAFAFPAKALPVRVCIFNPPMTARIAAGELIPESPEITLQWEKEDGSWAIGVSYPTEGVQLKRYPGHLVAVCSDIIIDLSLDQANRPAREIQLHPLAFRAPFPFLNGDTSEIEIVSSGCLLIYRKRPADTRYLSAPDFCKRDRRKPAVSRILQRIRLELKEAAAALRR